MPAVLVDATIISIVAYTVSFSMSKIFAKRHGYSVDATQELYALVSSDGHCLAVVVVVCVLVAFFSYIIAAFVYTCATVFVWLLMALLSGSILPFSFPKQGASNVFGSFFGCAPVAASLSRSLIQEAVGGVTQITSFICCSLILLVLLFVGPVFETLPNVSVVVIVGFHTLLYLCNI